MSIHINAKKEEIAKIVIMPGDPKRAELIAKKYLKDYRLVNDVRGMCAYTGEYNGKKITVMGSGMGIPSMGIYSYELYNEYDVDIIIRVGSMGSNNETLKLRDVLVVASSYTESEFAKNLTGVSSYISYPDYELTQNIYEVGKKEYNGVVKKGNIACSECFDKYTIDKKLYYNRIPKKHNILGCEMESFALFKTAEFLNKKAACILTVVDANYTDKALTSKEREQDLDIMVDIVFKTIKEII